MVFEGVLISLIVATLSTNLITPSKILRTKKGKNMKKRIYSKDKTPRYGGKEIVTNDFELICAIKKLPKDIWFNYINEVVMCDYKDDELKYLINEIPSKNLQKAIIVELMNTKDFNPYKIDLSLIENDNYRNLLLNKQKYLNRHYKNNKKIKFNNLKIFICHTSYYDKVVRADIKILYNSHDKRILFKNNSKKSFNIKELFEEINELDNQKWEHNKAYTAFWVKPNYVSILNKNKILRLIKKYVIEKPLR
jgi:hypothetical protein